MIESNDSPVKELAARHLIRAVFIFPLTPQVRHPPVSSNYSNTGYSFNYWIPFSPRKVGRELYRGIPTQATPPVKINDQTRIFLYRRNS